MCSTNRPRLAPRGRVAALLILAIASGRGTWAADSPTVILRAGAAQGKSGVEVRLRWSITDGWLPDGGFNLYRSDRTTPLNATPLGATSSIANSAQIDIGGSHAFQIGKLLQKARQAPSASLPPLTVVQVRPPSAQAEFDRLAAPPPASPPPTSTRSAVPIATGPAATQAAPMVTTHSVTLIPSAPPMAAEAALASRRTLLLGAALHHDVGTALGLSFDDGTVTPGQTYTYTLRPISNGTEGAPLATVSLTVPTDASALKPSIPRGLRAIQTGVQTVALRWQRLDPQTEADMGVAKYDVFRKKENTKQQKLNTVPVLVVNVGTPGPLGTVTNLHEPDSFFTDTAAVTGRVEYELVVTDIFDRSSDPAKVVLSVADLHKPNPVPLALAQLQPSPVGPRLKGYRRTEPFHISRKSPPSQPVLIAWRPSPDPGVAYRIYRVDTEKPGQAPQSLTPAPVPGSSLSGPALPPGTIRETLAAQECSRVAHAGMLSAQSGLQNISQGSFNSSKKGSLNNAQIPSCNLAALSGSDRASFEQTLLASVQMLTWTDSSAQKDHYYRYYVASVFTSNAQEATPIQSNIVAYPDLTPPGMPSGETAQFQPAGAAQKASSSGRSGLQNRTDMQPASHAGKVASLTLTNWSGPLVKEPPHDTGGTMVLKWQPVAGAVKYEIYRANVTRISVPANSTLRTAGNCPASPGNSQPGTQPAGGSSQTASGTPAGTTVSGHPVAVSMPICIGVPLLASITWQVPPQDSDFVLLGAARTTEYDDALSRSSADYYQYRIVPVNRWNVPGSMAAIDARAPATQPPTPPKLVVGAASPDGGAQVEFLPDTDAGEEVVRYELLRSNLFQIPSTGTPPPASTAANPPSSAMNSNSPQPSNLAAAQSPLPAAMNYGSASMGSSRTDGSARTGTVQATEVAARMQLAGTAARYGITLHQPIMAAVARAGTSIEAAMQASILQAHTVAQVNATDLPAGSNTGAWFADTSGGLDWRKDYAYVVKAIDKDGLSSLSEPVDLTPLKLKAGAPANLSATWNTHSCVVDLSWQSTDPDSANFVVERLLLTPSTPVSPQPTSGPVQGAVTAQGVTVEGTTVSHSSMATEVPIAFTSGPDYIQLSMNPATTYTDRTVFPDNSYQYRVRTMDQKGNLSAPTNAAQTVTVPDGCGTTASVLRASSTTASTRPPAALSPAASGATGVSAAPSVAGGSPAPAPAPSPSVARASSQIATITPEVLSAAIPVKGVTTLTFHIQNTTSSPLTAFSLTATLPAGLIVALPNALANTCGGKANAPAWMNSLALTGGSIPANGSCVVSVKVTGTTAGQKQVTAVVNLSGGSRLTSNSTTITVLQTNPGQPSPSNPTNQQKKPAQPTAPKPRKAVAA